MTRKKRRTSKRSLTVGGIALEVATLLAILVLARPDWIARGFQVVERYQSTTQNVLEPRSPSRESVLPAPNDNDHRQIAPQLGIFPPRVSEVSPGNAASGEVSRPAVVIPAGEWLPGYFDIVEHKPPVIKRTMTYGHQQYRLSTPMNPWAPQNGRHF
ncbi:MAG: hypothetical protein Aurels2KO_21070 [Aureliella sp.]